MSLFFIGPFPPKWGGVTVKNCDLYNELIEKGISVEKIDLNLIKRKKSLREFFRLLKAITGRNNRYIIGISAASRRSFSRLLYFINRKAMRRSVSIVMGGAAARDISADPKYILWMSEFKRIYVETKGMLNLLTESGMTNVSIYPNCRKKIEWEDTGRKTSEKLQCVFFSFIQKEKGVDEIFKSAASLPDVDFTFYGSIDHTYEKEFYQSLRKNPNCTYKGVFKGTDESKYRELSGYDILLLPTKWTTEGIPGVLVEAKIAGLSCIVSNVSYNSEIITDNEDGIVLARNDSGCLTEAIRLLNEDRNLLDNQKTQSRRSADNYYIESYIDYIIHDINS